MRKVMILMMLFALFPCVAALSVGVGSPQGVISIEQNSTPVEFSIGIDYEYALPNLESISNPWCGVMDTTIYEGGKEYNITLEGCINNESQALGNATYILPAGERCFFWACSFHNETVLTASLFYDNGTCYVWDAVSIEDDEVKWLLPQEGIFSAQCSIPEGNESVSEHVSSDTIMMFNLSDNQVMPFYMEVFVNNNSTEFTYDDGIIRGSVTADDNDFFDVIVVFNTPEGIMNQSWSFATTIPEPSPPPIIIYEDDDGGSHGGGGYYPIMIRDAEEEEEVNETVIEPHDSSEITEIERPQNNTSAENITENATEERIPDVPQKKMDWWAWFCLFGGLAMFISIVLVLVLRGKEVNEDGSQRKG